MTHCRIIHNHYDSWQIIDYLCSVANFGLFQEKELKKLKEEAEKEERRREKEEVEHKKLLKSQKDEAEREQKRHEKEEVEQKKKASMQRQALMMENLFKIKKTNTPSSNQENKISADMSSVSSEKNEVISTVISSMDLALSMQESYLLQDIHKLVVW